MIINFLEAKSRKQQPFLTNTNTTDDKPPGFINTSSSCEGLPVGQRSLSPTVKDLLRLYQKDYLIHKAPTTRVQQLSLHRIILADMGAMRLADLTPAFLRKWRDKLAKTRAPGTVRRYLSVLSGPLRVAVDDLQWLPENPLKRVPKPPESPGRVRYLSAEERERLLVACQKSGSPHLHAIVCVALSTGARRNEILTLTWSMVDLTHEQIRLPRTKNGDRRSVPLVGLGLEALKRHREQYPEATGLLFPCATGHRPIFIQHPFATACKRANVQHFRFHDLRHTFASYMAMSGASLLELAELLGHRNLNMVQRYSHLTNSHLNGIVAKMTQEFLPE